MRKLILICFSSICLFSLTTSAQIYPNIGQFHLAQLYYNPAYAGSSTQLRAVGIHRSQWAKLPGAPNTQLIAVDKPLGKKVGGGLLIHRHQIGDTWQVGLSANASYRVNLGRETYLQFGLKAGAYQVDFAFNNAFRWDENDPYLISNSGRGIIGTVGTGAYFKKKSFYVGLGVPDLVVMDPNKLYYDQSSGKSLLKRNFFFNSGIKINISEFIALEPHILVRYYPSRPLNYYANLSVIFNQTFTAGAGFVYPKGLALYTHVNVSPKFILGYRYELNANTFGNQSYGSNEILIRYGFN
ncbi:MAG: type IX secretion system membrane protein PorP/SprF [Cytophagaceae bacterium]